jgi:tetratricopeptide (TPR) repeat protein
MAQHHFEQAITTSTQAFDLRVQILGDKHQDLVESLSHLASVYLAQKEYQRAEPYLLQALSLYQEAQRPEDMILDPVLNGLAEIEIARERLEMAQNYLDRSRAIRELALGQSDPRTIEIIRKLTSIADTNMKRHQG